MATSKNIVTDYGADDTGVTDVVNILRTVVNPAMQGIDLDLTFPDNGVGHRSYAWTGGSSFRWINGIGNLNILTTGTSHSGGSINFQTAHVQQAGIDNTTGGIDGTGGKNARIKTVSAGATSVELTTTGLPAGSGSAGAGYVSRFSVGQRALITGWAVQGLFQAPGSFPPNWHFVDFVTITGIVGNVVSFTPALTNSYSDTWPEMNRGNANETDAAGPATLVGLNPAWTGTTTITGGTWDNTAGLINSYRENMILTGATFTTFPVYPSVNRLYQAVNCTATGALTEHDKLNDWVDLQGGTYSNWKCQSSSTRLLTMTGTTFSSIGGTVGDTIIDGCTIGSGGLVVGATAYGRSKSIVVKNTTFDPAATISGMPQEKGPSDGLASEVGVQGYTFKTGTVIRTPICLGDNVSRYTAPDAQGRNILFWGGNNGSMGSFRYLSATSDSWPATDNQSSAVSITVANGSKSLNVSSSIFSSGDVGKTIKIPGYNLGGNEDVTITNASPGVVTKTAHGRVANDPIRFSAGAGVLPSGLTAGVTYYVSATGLTTNTFTVSATVGGAQINTSGGSGTVRATSNSGDLYTIITGFTDAQNVTVFHASTHLGLTSVARTIQWGTCNVYYETGTTDPLPDPTTYNSSGKLTFYVPPVRTSRFESCTGTAMAVDLSQPAAWNRPLYSYTKRPYTGDTLPTGSASVPMHGSIQSIKINVTQAYTGAQGTLTFGLGQFGITLMIGGVWTSYNPRINLKVVGERVITIGNTTGTQAGDSALNLTSAAWIGGSFSPSIAINISAESSSVWPIFTVEMITDQGFPAAVVPLRLRLRA